ncbi:MAG: UPF0109 protein [Myxococcales bacterium]
MEGQVESQGEILRDLVEFMVRAIVDAPADVRATVVESGTTVVVELAVAREDIGKVIGREGGMAQALRTILANAGTKLKRRTVLQILD